MPNDVMRRTLNTMFNPFSDDILDPGFTINNDPELSRQVARAGALAATYGVGAYGVRSLLNSSQKKQNANRRSQLKSYLNARYPIISLDSSVGDELSEEEARESGLEKAAIDSKRTPVYALALSVAAGVLGATGGAKMADISHASEDKREQQEELKKKRNTYDKELLSEYQDTRGISKVAEGEMFQPSNTSGRPPSATDRQSKTPSGQSWGDKFKDAYHTMGKGWVLWAVASSVAAFHMGKKKFDELDPNRQRLKDIEEVSKNRARSQRAPVFLEESDMSEEGPEAPSKPKSISSVALPGKPREERESDLL